MRRLVLPLIALVAAAPAPAGTVGPTGEATGDAARIDAAIAALGPVGGPGAADPAAVAGLVAALREQEAALAAASGAVRVAEARAETGAEGLDARRLDVLRFVARLEAMTLSARSAPASHPAGPIAAARAERLLDWLRPGLEAEARRLAGELGELEAARTEAEAGLARLDEGLDGLERGRAALLAALEPDQAAAPIGLAARDAPPGFAREADNLSALAARLAAATGAAPVLDAPVDLAWPVVGGLRAGFEDKDLAGVKRPGLLLEAAPRAVVVAPAAGVVRYAGPFLDYGYVVILEPRPDVLVVLAGLATLETRVGAQVASGELLGLLGGRPLDAQEYLMLAEGGNGETGAETLYIELRHGRGPVDPAPWFASGKG